MTDMEMFRHTVATLAYRASKTMRGAPATFAAFRPGPTSNTPHEIVAHMGDLFDWALTLLRGEPKWNVASTSDWGEDCARFFAALKIFDDKLASGEPIKGDLKKIFQGPVADALTHTGQLAMLRRLHGAPMKGENYSKAEIVIGRVSADQKPPDARYEFN